MDEPGPLLASGRAADVYEYGPKRVLRRYRTAYDCEPEAVMMQWAHRHGVPVPEVFEASGRDMVMERLEGRSLLQGLATRPHRLMAAGRVLGDLHLLLDRVPTPPGDSPPDGTRQGLVHGDLHPGNVMMTPAGPVLIDWSNARAGSRDFDVATTWAIVACFGLPSGRPIAAVEGLARRAMIRGLFQRTDRREAAQSLAAVLSKRNRDPNISAAEIARLQRLVGRT